MKFRLPYAMRPASPNASFLKNRKNRLLWLFYGCATALVLLQLVHGFKHPIRTNGDGGGSTACVPSKGRIKLRLGWSEGGWDSRDVSVFSKIHKALAEEFFRTHPSIYPEWNRQIKIPEEAQDGSLLMALAGGSAPDVIAYPIYKSHSLMDQDFLEPLDAYIAREIQEDPDFPERIAVPEKLLPVITRYDPKTEQWHRYGLIKIYDFRPLYYRKDLFVEAGLDPKRPPKTWDELFTYAMKLSYPEKQIIGAPFQMGQMGLNLVVEELLMNFIWQAGGDLVRQYKTCPSCARDISAVKESKFETCPICQADLRTVLPGWKVTWAEGDAPKALAFLKRMRWTPWMRCLVDGEPVGDAFVLTQQDYERRAIVRGPDGRMYDLSDPDVYAHVYRGVVRTAVTEQDTGESLDMFARGETAMLIDWMKEERLIEMEKRGINFHNLGIAALPVGPSGSLVCHMGATVLGINAQADPESKQAAWEYIKFYCSEAAKKIRTRILVEHGLYQIVKPTNLQRFGFQEFYDRLDPGLIAVQDHIEQSGRSMPWNPGWQSCLRTFFPEPTTKILELKDGYRYDPYRVLKEAQDQANQIALKDKDELYYQRIRKWAYVAFAGILTFMAWMIRRIVQGQLERVRRQSAAGHVQDGGRSACRRTITAALFLAPAVLSVLVWNYYPLFDGAGMAFFDYKLLEGFSSKFVGIDNFIEIVHSPLFYKVLRNTFLYVFLTLSMGFVVPIILALLLDEVPQGKVFFRVVFYLPAMVSPLVTMLLWKILYFPTEQGLLNKILLFFGLEMQTWLRDPGIAMICIIIPGIWAGAGPASIIYLAALKVVPEDLYEAVAIDGGTLLHKLLHVTLPALLPLVVINFIGAFIGAWQAMQNIFVLTGGGPLSATRVIGIEIWYNAFVYLRFGYATAMAWILGALLIGFMVMQLRMFNKVEFKSADTA